MYSFRAAFSLTCVVFGLLSTTSALPAGPLGVSAGDIDLANFPAAAVSKGTSEGIVHKPRASPKLATAVQQMINQVEGNLNSTLANLLPPAAASDIADVIYPGFDALEECIASASKQSMLSLLPACSSCAVQFHSYISTTPKMIAAIVQNATGNAAETQQIVAQVTGALMKAVPDTMNNVIKLCGAFLL